MARKVLVFAFGFGFVFVFVFAFAVASASWLRASCSAVRCSCLFTGIRVLLACFRRRPCAGRHLLFFAAAKKSRQKKAAHTASPC
ncbi:hypothetical protein, partial [Paraburkholderia caribensis]|uniref:hypothetical protein n=1 Tax=Paraburkholderia caribensis TaxID=75105 RepID=UPI001CC64187